MLKKNIHRLSINTLALLLMMGVGLCACDNSDRVNKLVAQVMKTKAKDNKTDTLNIQMPAAVIYQASALKSPFDSAGNVASGKNPDMHPLLFYPVNVLKFTGTLLQNNNYIAYIVTPDNKIYAVAVGDRIGDREGKVVAITSNRLEIIENGSNEKPGSPQQTIVLQLKEEQQ